MEREKLGAAEGLPPIEWAAVREILDAGDGPRPDDHNARSTWLTTIAADGRPHVTPVGALWLDGTYWFQTGASTAKAQNLARDPRCALAVSIRDADLVVEGEAEPVTDPAQLAEAAAGWAAGGWPAEVHESGTGITAPFNAPRQGSPPWGVYRIAPRSATVCWGAEPGGLTRFTFD